MKVEVTRDPTFRFGIPRPVFENTPGLSELVGLVPIPAPDNERSISVRNLTHDAKATGSKIRLIENWNKEFRERARR